MHWRRKWQPTQCSCLENPRDGGAVGCHLWGRTEDTTEVTEQQQSAHTYGTEISTQFEREEKKARCSLLLLQFSSVCQPISCQTGGAVLALTYTCHLALL